MDSDTATQLLATMWRIRHFEERVAQLKRNLQVHGLIHLSIGGEGVAAGVCGQLRASDAVYSSHRAHGHAIWRKLLWTERSPNTHSCARGAW